MWGGVLETAIDVVASRRRCRKLKLKAPHEENCADGSGFIVRRSTLRCQFGSSSQPAWSDAFLDLAASSRRGASALHRRVLL